MQRNLDEVKALSRDEAVEIMRQAGIVGAGGGGFPTYFKWKSPQPNLIVNCTESEPGYWADKVLHREYFDEFLELFDVMKTIFGIERVIMGVHFKDEEWFSRYDENTDGLYEVVHVPDKYSMGEEKTLIKNIYNAFFLGKPVTTKYLQVFGRDLELELFEAPLGSSATELLKLSGVDVEAEAGNLSVIDGGPYLNEMGIESLGESDAYVRRTTNGFLVIPKGVASKEYANIKTRRPEGVTSLVGRISGVSVPLGGRFLKPATALVSEGDEVSFEQKIGEPVDEGFSIGVWSSMDGTISYISEEIVQVSGGAMPKEDAQAETEAEAAR